MSLTKRIIPCLDVDQGRVVKGVNFIDIRDAGDPVEVAKNYNDQGADEICILDITASHEGRDTQISTIEKIAAEVFIPLTVGGGVSELKDIRNLLNAGADKVAINSAAVNNPNFVKAAADKFGSQCIVVSIDAKRIATEQSSESQQPQWRVFTHGGRKQTPLCVLDWAAQMQDYGVGELLLTSMDGDGTKKGFDIELCATVNNRISIPMIASGGVGNLQHLVDGVLKGKADAVLAASIFHFGQYSIAEAKQCMQNAGINMRL